jgi:hypothetical protein
MKRPSSGIGKRLIVLLYHSKNNFMRNKITLKFLYLLMCITSLSGFIIFYTGCNGGSELKVNSQSLVVQNPDNWLVLDVKFKPYVNKEIRGKAIQVLQEYLIDTVFSIRNNGNPEYHPSITIKSFPFDGDTSSYQIKISRSSDHSFDYALAKDTTVGPSVPCKCPTCGICQKAKTILLDNTPLSQFVESFTTQ